MRIHGVTIDFVKRMQERDIGVTVDELVTMRIHGVGELSGQGAVFSPKPITDH